MRYFLTHDEFVYSKQSQYQMPFRLGRGKSTGQCAIVSTFTFNRPCLPNFSRIRVPALLVSIRISGFVFSSFPAQHVISLQRTASRSRIGHFPGVQPLEVVPLLVLALHTESDGSKQPEQTNHNGVKCGVDCILNVLVQPACSPVDDEPKSDDGEIEGRIVVMDVGDTSHGDEWQIVKEPAEHRVDARVMNLVNVALRELVVATLPSDAVPEDHETKDA